MGRMEDIDARLKSRMDAMNKRLSGRMAALDARMGGGAGREVGKSFDRSAHDFDRRLKDSARNNVRRVALCVGMKDVSKTAYFPNVPRSLPGCPIDVDRFACALSHVGFVDDDVLVLKDENATCANVYRTISSTARALHDGDLFVLLISGHGSRDSWCLYDGELENWVVIWTLSRFHSGVRILMINDQCHSGALFEVAEQAKSVFVSLCSDDGWNESWNPEEALRSKEFPMVVQFASCLPNQNSADAIAGGSWTQALINALDQFFVDKSIRSYREWFNVAKNDPHLVKGEQDPDMNTSPNVTDAFLNAKALT